MSWIVDYCIITMIELCIWFSWQVGWDASVVERMIRFLHGGPSFVRNSHDLDQAGDARMFPCDISGFLLGMLCEWPSSFLFSWKWHRWLHVYRWCSKPENICVKMFELISFKTTSQVVFVNLCVCALRRVCFVDRLLIVQTFLGCPACWRRATTGS